MRGPFEIGPGDIARLGVGFTDAVNRLLETEAAAAGMVGSSLVLNWVEYLSDGGVDAAIRSAPAGTDWIPEGDSAWQFKRSDLYPKACAREFGGATWAQDLVATGSSYILVLGVALTDQKLERRKDEIVKKACEIGLGIESSRVRVYDANALARWTSLYPALTVSRAIGGPGLAVVDFSTWANTRLGRTVWVADEKRLTTINAIRSALSSPGFVELRVQGASGVGKSRLVMEALRGSEWESLVAYVADESDLTGELLQYFTGANRVVVLIVDRCPADRHISIAERLPDHRRVKLLTVGPTGHPMTARPVVVVDPLPNEDIDTLLSNHFPGLPDQHRRVVVDNSDGHPQVALVLAERALDTERELQAADLVTEADIGQFVSDRSPGSLALRVTQGVALFDKLGWEEDLSGEREWLSHFLQVSLSDIKRAGEELEQAGWLVVRGRYREVASHRLAVFLASQMWKKEGARVVGELLERMSGPMVLALFRRLADLGRVESIDSALAPLLASEGPFSSLQTMQVRGTARLLTQLAIVLPTEVATHLAELVEWASEDELRNRYQIRRDLVGTLQKLAWHTNTFELASDTVLQLALAENEPYANNATGVWKDLFGTLLPATAADTDARMDYMRKVARSDSVRRRLMAVGALKRAIKVREATMVSAEIQGGVLVESRGAAKTWEEVWDYKIKAIKEIGRLASDSDEKVGAVAEECLIEAIYSLIGTGRVWEALQDVLVSTPALHNRVRQTLQHLEGVYERRSRVDGNGDSEATLITGIEAVSVLKARLPEPIARDALTVILHQNRWLLPDGQLENRVVDAITAFLEHHQEGPLFALLNQQQWPAAWEFGAGLVSLDLREDPVDALVAAYGVNPDALQGYLDKKRKQGAPRAVESFLDSPAGENLADTATLEVACLDRDSQRVIATVQELASRLPVAESVRRIPVGFPVPTHLIVNWSNRIETQEDYDELAYWLAIRHTGTLADEMRLSSEVFGAVLEIVLRRRSFPNVKNRWAWGQLAEAVLPGNEGPIATLILDLIEDPSLPISMDEDEEAQLLKAALGEKTDEVWKLVAGRLEAPGLFAMSVRKWILSDIDTAPIHDWIGDSIHRARIVATIASPGENEPTPITRYLLDKFGQDNEIKGSLYNNYVSGVWSGKQSEYIQQKIDLLNTWRQDRTEPQGVRQWAKEAVDYLKSNRQRTLREEAEGH